MAKTMTAKVKVRKVQPLGDGQTSLGFYAHYTDDEGNRVNEEWAKYTPALSLDMTVLDSVAEGIELGQACTLTLAYESGSKSEAPQYINGG